NTIYGLTRRVKKEGMLGILRNKPIPKTFSLQKYIDYLDYVKSHLQPYFEFYKSDTAKKSFHLYQSRQREQNKMSNILIYCGRKYN
ncbi:hypothetical protein J3Q64DRAFT_1616786, partial [Phycomyces blakesleeanus]